MSEPAGASPQSADPTVLGGAHVRALVDDIVGQLEGYLREQKATNAAKLIGAAPLAINTRSWLTSLFEATHPDLVALPRVRLDEVEASWILGLTADDEPVTIAIAPDGDDRVRVTLTPNGNDADAVTLWSDAEGARVTFLAGLAMSIHQHSAFRTLEQTNEDHQEVTDSER